MSEGGALTETELVELRSLLDQARAEVEHSVAASTADSKPVDLGLAIGRLSRVDALQQQHMALARRERVELRKKQIAAALSRLDEGSYGACVKCGEPIGYARLRVRPETTLPMPRPARAACPGGTADMS
jgi:DnaK suppressor protein